MFAKKVIARAKQIGVDYADSLYENMLNPEFQGHKFEWKNFPSMVAKLAKVSAFMYFRHEIDDEVKQIAYDSAFERAKTFQEVVNDSK